MNSSFDLRQSTAQTVPVGIFADPTDGVTPVTNLVLANLANATLIKADGSTVSILGRTWIHKTGGMYLLSLLATDVDVLGALTLVFTDPTLLTPVWQKCQVLDQPMYDAWHTEGGIANLQVNVTLGPVSVSQLGGNITPRAIPLAAFRGEAKTFVIPVFDADGDPVDLSGMTLRMQFETTDLTALFNPAAPILVQGADDNEAVIAVTALENTFDVGTYQWRLWDDDGETVLAHGPYGLVATSE